MRVAYSLVLMNLLLKLRIEKTIFNAVWMKIII